MRRLHALVFLGALGAIACGSDDADDAASAGGESGSGGKANAGGASAGGNGGTSAAAGSGGSMAGSGGGGTSGTSGEPAVHFVGRMDRSDPAGPRFEWSGSGAVARFMGSSVSVQLSGGAENQFAVVIDGAEQPKITLAQAGPHALASGLGEGPHQVEIYRRTEAFFNATQFLGFDFGDGELLPPQLPTRRIEVIGDSITCGYGNEGTIATCPFTADTENHYASYGAVAARMLDAELVSVAWSGKGVVYNYGEDAVDPLPALYGRTLPTQAASSWDFSIVPDAVVINLGTNDFSTDGDPTTEQFASAYADLLGRIRDNYPSAFILCTVGPMLAGTDLELARTAIQAGIDAFQAAGGDNVRAWQMNIPNDSPGCDYHPSLATHQAMADALAVELAQELGW
jgi:lysophospholipase L1-like esterase